MTRTQLYLPEQVHRQLNRLADEKSLSMAGVIRDFIEQGLKKIQIADSSGKATLREVVGLQLQGGDNNYHQSL